MTIPSAPSAYDLVIRCDYFVPMCEAPVPEVQRDVFLGIRNGEIAEIAAKDISGRAKKFIDARDKAVLPGLVNGHTHLAMTLFRGLEDDLPFQKWLFERILPLESKLVDRDFVRIGTELGAIESIRFGVTSVCDMYFFAETSAEVIDRAGIRALVGQVFASVPFPEDKVVGSDKAAAFRKLYDKYTRHPRIVPTLAPHAPYTCSEAVLREVTVLSNEYGCPIHIHVSETQAEVEESRRRHGKTPVQYLYELGILKGKTVCAHCVHLDEADADLFHKSGASVVYNPDSNLKLSSGIAPISRYLKKGIPVAIGTDGAASNNDLSIFGAMDIGTKIQKLAQSDNTAMVAGQTLRCATIGGATALGIDDKVGSLEVGKRADIVIVDLKFPHMQPVHNIISQLVYSAQGLEVDTVICDGKLLMESKKVLALDEERVFREAAIMRDKIQQAIGELAK